MKDVLSSILNLKDNKNATFLLIGGVLVLICIVIIIYFSFFYDSTSNYDLRSVIEKAAVKYCDDNCDELFKSADTIGVSDKTLIEGNYMKDFDSLTGDKNNTCEAEVVITKAYDGYNLITNVDCGEDYSENNIVDVVTSDNSIVTDGAGLYEINDNKVYRGEYVNNYLKLGNTMFRIVKINSDNTLMLVLSDYNNNLKGVWDDRYNSFVEKNDGINDYSVSRARESLNGFISSLYASDIGKKAMNYDYCVGSRLESDTVNDGSIECSKKYKDYIALLPVYDFINASLDVNCKSVDNSKVCQNYNYLSLYDNDFWFITSVKDTTNQLFYYDGAGIDLTKARSKYSLRFVITISGDEVYKSGNGTLNDPYVIYE